MTHTSLTAGCSGLPTGSSALHRLRTDRRHREHVCPARPGSHMGTAEQGGTHSDMPSWESVSTGYHVQQRDCWVTLPNPEKQQQRP